MVWADVDVSDSDGERREFVVFDAARREPRTDGHI